MAKFNEISADVEKISLKERIKGSRLLFVLIGVFVFLLLYFVAHVVMNIWDAISPPMDGRMITTSSFTVLSSDPDHFYSVESVPCCDLSEELFQQIRGAVEDEEKNVRIDGVVVRTTMRIYKSGMFKEYLVLTCESDYLFETADIEQAYEDHGFAWFQARVLECEFHCHEDEGNDLNAVLNVEGEEEVWIPVSSAIELRVETVREMIPFRYLESHPPEPGVEEEAIVEESSIASDEVAEEGDIVEIYIGEESARRDRELEKLLALAKGPSTHVSDYDWADRLLYYKDEIQARYVPGVPTEDANRPVHLIEEGRQLLNTKKYPSCRYRLERDRGFY